jgi:hypothetical protein
MSTIAENATLKKEGQRAFQYLDEPRCPHCGKSFNPGQEDSWSLYKEGEHSVFCTNEDCEREFMVSTRVSHSFTTII